MYRCFFKLCLVVAVFSLLQIHLFAQYNPTGNLSGTVTDSTGAVVPGAAIDVTETSTGSTYHTKSGGDGQFFIGNMPPGTYKVTVTLSGFQTAVYQAVQIVVGQTYNLKAVLQPGQVTSTVTVEAGQQIVETSQSSVGLSISGPVITHVPTPSNSALYGLALMSPDVQTIGGPRQSSADGLPGGAVNITYDGIAAQWQPGKSGDPLFTMITPNIDDVAEFTITSASGSAAETGQGAVQLKFVSPRGTNQFHGGAWEYFRNDYLNANYYFNNLAGLPRQTMRYNQVGGKIGGPIIKDKLFFFADINVWVRPQGVSRVRTILNPAAASGIYTYAPSAMPSVTPPWVTCNAAAGTCSANLLQMAGAFGGNTHVDSVVGQALTAMQQATQTAGVHLLAPPSLYQEQLTFNNRGAYTQQMPDLRLDWNITSNHSLEADYHLTRFTIGPDIFNNGDYSYPVAPFNTNQGGYFADRQIYALAWRWNVAPTVSNELRFGIQTSPESFLPDLNLSVYPLATTNLGTIRIQPVFPSTLGLDNPWLQVSPTRDNPAVGQLTDNLAWSKGNHNLSFGFNATREHYKDWNFAPEFGTVQLGMSATDPLAGIFTTGNLPGMSANDLNISQQLYALLTGRITSYSGTVALNPSTRQFQTGRFQSDQYHQTDLGFYGTDSWRLRPTFTLNYGLRWQYEGVPVDDLNQYYTLQGGLAGLYGVSGVGHLFAPGVMTGSVPQYVLDNGKPWYNNWYKGWAPSVGFAWQPSFGNSIAKSVLGPSGGSVIRAGYAISYVQEGLFNWPALSNPGYTGAQFTSPIAPGSPIIPGEFPAGSLALQSLNIPTLAQNPASFGNPFPANPTANQSVNVADPNLHMPYVQSWSVGVQRSLGTNTAIEVRYVGNHAVGLWENENLNEVNIFENGFLSEFNNARNNLAICEANAAACLAAQAAAGISPSVQSFGDFGLPGQVSLPVFTAAFTGSRNAGPGNPTQGNSNFSSGAFITPLTNGQAGSVATILSGAVPSASGPGVGSTGAMATSSGLTYWNNLVAAGFPRNFWVVNPDATGGAFYLRNGFQSTYNALVVDFRRRPAKGLTFDANYTLAHSLTDDWQRNGNNTTEAFVTLRNQSLMKGPSPYDIRNAVKIYLTYEFPFGPGRRWSSSHAIINALLGGWQFNSFNRWQTGRPTILFGGLGGTVNQYDGGITLNGLTTQQLQNELGVYKTPYPAPGAVWYVPQTLLGPGGQGINTSVLNACMIPGQFCSRVFVYGPSFFDADWSLQKTTKIKERVTFELRLEAINVFNNVNFLWGDAYNTPGASAGAVFFSTVSANLQNPSFGRIFTGYQDLDSTDSSGGRMLQLVARFSF